MARTNSMGQFISDIKTSRLKFYAWRPEYHNTYYSEGALSNLLHYTCNCKEIPWTIKSRKLSVMNQFDIEALEEFLYEVRRLGGYNRIVISNVGLRRSFDYSAYSVKILEYNRREKEIFTKLFNVLKNYIDIKSYKKIGDLYSCMVLFYPDGSTIGSRVGYMAPFFYNMSNWSGEICARDIEFKSIAEEHRIRTKEYIRRNREIF